MKTFNIGIVGLGTIGSAVYRLLKTKSAFLRQKTGIDVQIKYVCDKDAKKMRALGVKKDERVASYQKMLNMPDLDCVVELIGGINTAKKVILDAFKRGKDVVTANKALLAEEGEAIFGALREQKRQLYFEASVGGGIPIIKSLQESLVANHVNAIYGIINGTSNYILTKMMHEQMSFDDALSLAQQKGYAEANPSFDIEGIDSAHKITILSELAFNIKVDFSDVSCEGISNITQGDIAYAQQLGYVIKLLAIAKKTPAGLEVRVQPTFLPQNHILSNVDDSYNAIYLMCDEVENMLFYGRGAGARPTASAVVSDIIDLARTKYGYSKRIEYPRLRAGKMKKISAILSRYYVCIPVIDRPGVLATLASILGRYHVSISDVIQKERKLGRVVPVVLLTHATSEKNIRAAVSRINKLSAVRGTAQIIRMEE